MRWALNAIKSKNKKQDTPILPDLLLRADKLANILHTGSHGRKKSGLGERFWQFRGYHHGDDIKRIDWRQSAKSDALYIRQSEWEAAQTALFWLDTRKSMFVKSKPSLFSKYEAACLIASTLALATIKAGENIFNLNAPEVPANHTAKTCHQHARYWLSAEESKDIVLPHLTIPKSLKNGCAIILSDGWDDLNEIGHMLKNLRQKCDKVLFIQIHDPIELNLDLSGAIEFEDFSKTDTSLFQNVTDIRSAYKDRVREHLNAFAKMCHTLNVNHIHACTDRDITKTLEQAWRILSEASK